MPLKFHPLADIFPLLEGEEFDALVADIKANGLREPVVLYDGKVLDGRNRVRACNAAGVPVRVEEHNEGCGHIGDPWSYVVSKNIHRRHLTAAQKRDLIAKVIAAKPEASDRQIAKQVKADHKTVGSVRAEREATGEVSPVEKRVGADGKARKTATKKAPARFKDVIVQSAGKTDEEVHAEVVAATMPGIEEFAEKMVKAVEKFSLRVDGQKAQGPHRMARRVRPKDANSIGRGTACPH
jgi:ParB-like nuclease domain